MVKIQLRRTKRGEYHNEDHIDFLFVKGGMNEPPTIGESFTFYRNRMDAGWWKTTPVVNILRTGRVIEFETKNSTYVIKKGWGE